ncbi:DUF4007 family protein [Rossellomorea sp. y25]|uniref:DUF4007 family protein n=1 Tax=Rossellomorea sp. y25 TaxID=3118174 RepID=UPI0030E0EBCE
MTLPLSFHQKFAPEKEAIAQLVQFASSFSEKYFTKEEISSQTTIPTGKVSGKVVPHIEYAILMGLLEVKKDKSKYQLSLTSLGNVVSEEDPYLIESLTHLLCHYNLTNVNSKALLWSFIFNNLFNTQGLQITSDSLKRAVNRFFETKEVNISPFRTCYLEEKCFGNLNLLNFEEGKFLLKPHKVDRTFKFLYGYLLLFHWEKILSDESEITYDTLLNDLGFGNPFMWDETSINEVLEMLQEERIIVINRQLSPVTFIKQTSSSTLLVKVYSLLI